MDIVDFPALTNDQRAQAAQVMRAGFAPIGAYQGEAADAEVTTFFEDPDRFALAALIEGVVVGFVGGIDSYPKAVELHPMVVDPAHQAKGVGAALLAALEARAAAMGKLTVYLGTDDEIGGTSLFAAEVFPGALAKLAAIEPTSGHAFFFYRRHGYEPVGLIPDANGYGKPDLLMAKRVAKP
ncbi:MAG: GNAT family N-acetyltransferase [Phenylobacterium sp.]|uniref:GNAT family N-acetyltransferase n=1 Tax=Phenylobacterium sp. TaxID=1871053 RepID=UPI0027353648|nr:GNAT family N-acetyltransferase [Phenylobacterium sp.]MDP3746168.1 GNAT family N-acetyltransferase [Phenylobacterium sp.]